MVTIDNGDGDHDEDDEGVTSIKLSFKSINSVSGIPSSSCVDLGLGKRWQVVDYRETDLVLVVGSFIGTPWPPECHRGA